MGDEIIKHCSVCRKLLQYKWYGVDILIDEENTGGLAPGKYAICRPCFLKSMGVTPNGKTTDAEKMRKVSAGNTQYVRPRRTAVTRADIDRYRRSARADRDAKRKATDRASGKPVQEGSE